MSYCYAITDFSKLTNVQELTLQYCEQITNNHLQFFNNKRLLDLTGCKNITNVSDLNVENLNLSKCENIINISCVNIRILNLSECRKITDFSKLINVQELSLQHCMQITDKDVPFFVNKSFLDLKSCYKITNVDILLDNVKVLNLSYCTGITDCSPFADDGITTLWCDYIRRLK